MPDMTVFCILRFSCCFPPITTHEWFVFIITECILILRITSTKNNHLRMFIHNSRDYVIYKIKTFHNSQNLIVLNSANQCSIYAKYISIKLPDDVSIIGFDDLPIAAYTSPPLTTIRQDRTELGKSGFFALSSLLNGVSISTFLLHAQLIERKSTGKAPVI